MIWINGDIDEMNMYWVQKCLTNSPSVELAADRSDPVPGESARFMSNFGAVVSPCLTRSPGSPKVTTVELPKGPEPEIIHPDFHLSTATEPMPGRAAETLLDATLDPSYVTEKKGSRLGQSLPSQGSQSCVVMWRSTWAPSLVSPSGGWAGERPAPIDCL